MRFADLKSWNWEADDGIPVVPRQQLNMKYRIWMDEDVLQAIFVHYIGIKWCVNLKSALTDLVQYWSIWRWEQGSPIPREECDKRSYNLLNLMESGHTNVKQVDLSILLWNSSWVLISGHFKICGRLQRKLSKFGADSPCP
jgi:hypothetical protein